MLVRRLGAICGHCGFNGYFIGDRNVRKCAIKRCRFHQEIAAALAPNKTCDSALLVKLWERFGLYVMQKVRSCPEESQASIRQVVLDVTYSRRTAIDTRLQEIIAEAREAANGSCVVE